MAESQGSGAGRMKPIPSMSPVPRTTEREQLPLGSGSQTVSRRPPADPRQYLAKIAQMCVHAAESTDDHEVQAALQTLFDMPRLLRGQGFVNRRPFPEIGAEPFNVSADEIARAWDGGKA
jgi:hypothetical protein